MAVDSAELRKILADNIRAAAEAKGMSLNALADFAGVSRAQLYNMLAETMSPTVDWVCKIAGALELDPWRLLAPHLGSKQP